MKLEARNAMLRIAIRSSQHEDIWVLQGRLAGEVVDELISAWKEKRAERTGRTPVVDLVDVTFIDERGERALMQMMIEGAQFVVRGVYTRGLLENLKERWNQRA